MFTHCIADSHIFVVNCFRSYNVDINKTGKLFDNNVIKCIQIKKKTKKGWIKTICRYRTLCETDSGQTVFDIYAWMMRACALVFGGMPNVCNVPYDGLLLLL